MTQQSAYEAYAVDFNEGYTLALQQIAARLRAHVQVGRPKKGKAAQIIDHVYPVEAHEGGDDLSDTVWSYARMMPRWVYPRTFRLAIPVTQTEKLYTLDDPTNALVQTIVGAHMRATDSVIIDCMFRDVIAGADQDKVIAFDAAHRVPLDTGGAASGINRAKIDAAFEMFETNHVDLDDELPRLGISPRQHTLMRNIAEVSHSDFRALGGRIENGRVVEFMGFMPIVSTRLAKRQVGGTTILRCPIWVPSGVHLQPWLDPVTKITERPDKNHTVQIYSEARFDAVRAEEGRVIEVECNENSLPIAA